MKASRANILPRKILSNLQLVGEQIKLARKRRKLTISLIAERAQCSQLTVIKVERGTPTVSMGIYLRVLYALGLDEDILQIAKEDRVGRLLQDQDLLKPDKDEEHEIFG